MKPSGERAAASPSREPAEKATAWPSLGGGLLLLAAVSPISIAATNVAMALVSLLFVREWRAGRERPRPTALDGAIALWALANLLSAATSLDPLKSFRDLRNLGHWLIYYLVAWGVAAGHVELGRMLGIWLAAGSLAALNAIGQWSFGLDLLARGSEHPTGFFGGHLQFGHYSAVLLGVALALWGEGRGESFRWRLVPPIVLLGVGLVVSGGRGPWLAFVVIALAWTSWSRSRRALLAFVLLALVQIVFLMREPDGLGTYYRSYVAVEPGDAAELPSELVHSNLWRLTMWREGLRTFALRPVSGTGVETTGELSRDFRTRFRDFGVAHLHSDYFEILMTRGFAGLSAFVVLMMTGLRWLVPALGSTSPGVKRATVFGGIAAIIAHLVHGLTYFTIGSAPIQMGFYLALGMAAGAVQPARKTSLPELEPRRLTWLCAVFALLLGLERAAPWPSFWASAAAVAAIDLLLLLRRRPDELLGCALGLSFSFVVLAALVLLLPLQGGGPVTLRVVGGAGMPFAVLWLARRLEILRSAGVRSAGSAGSAG